ncbi:MAG: tetratricopeptide repeat protein, partial [Proteobacteria bacterium]|nr:tetratricopeptide repeat protein [Pseudomonadota bacterium]
CYRRSLALRPDHVETQRHLADTLRRLRRFDEAATAIRMLLALDPDGAESHAARGALLRDQGDFAGAAEAYRRALALDPKNASARNELGLLLMRDDRITEAIASFEAAIACEPDKSPAYHNLGWLLCGQGRHAAAVAAVERGIAANPDDAIAGSGLLVVLQYLPGLPPAELTRRHIAWAERHADPCRPTGGPAHANSPDPGRRLRVGYVSPDFRWHAVSDFLMPLLAHHDRAQVEIACYAEVAHADQRTAAFQRLADRWRLIVGQSDERVAAQIRDDGIDILVDLAGHTANHRLGVFARRPAPVQATWLGYPCTTGMAAIDYRLSDAVADPAPGADALHRERLIRLPHGFQAYGPRYAPPEVAAPPAAASGRITFGSFNNVAKINEGVIACWARILAAVSDSRLIIKFFQLADAETRAAYRARMIAAGIAPERLSLQPCIPGWRAHMSAYAEIDVALDPFPYNGTTTTCEALWMGVPVVTLAGDRHASRVGASLLTRVGVPELIAGDVDDYVAKASALARDLPRLTALRADLRARCAATLGDAATFAHDVEGAYRAMWTAWCDQRRAGDG